MNDASPAAAAGVSTAPLASETNPLRQATPDASAITPPETPLGVATTQPVAAQPPAVADRYGAAAVTPADTTPIDQPAPPVAGVPAASAAPPANAQSFAESWPAIQATLDRGELAAAHQQLSRWYGDTSLTPTDAERVESLLNQLAGTVVYSTEHQLAPARVVKQGETLETIAQENNVPAELLAKINGIPAKGTLQPGQELKVVRGPFSAIVDLTRNQLTLMVDGRYAGKFPVAIAPGKTIADGEWVVGKKSNEQAPGRALLLQGSAAAPGAAPAMLILASETLANSGADNGSMITMAPKDAEDVSDILSIGSRVTTRR